MLLACKNKPEKTFVIPSDNEINSIIEAVIYQDSLPVLKDDVKINIEQIQLVIDLRKLILTLPDTTRLPPPPDPKTISMPNLLSEKVKGKTFFTKFDSSFILFQNHNLKSFTINKKISNKILETTIAEEQLKETSRKPFQFYELTIPIISFDCKRAYVEKTFNHLGQHGKISERFGDTTAIYLEKINNKWRIIDWKIIRIC